MSDHKKRIDTMKVILTGSPVSRASAYPMILGELNLVLSVKSIQDKKRKYLLQILHSTRALDSTLSAFIRERPINLPPPPDKLKRSLGGYLKWLSKHTTHGVGKLPSSSANNYQISIVKPRNKYMHQAGTYPLDEREISKLLSEMYSCMSVVLAL
jgi:hypothetical protein